jgi:hypothetical protein
MLLRIDEALNILRPEPPNLDGLKKAYYKKAIEFHPDKNPHGLEMMKLINNAYELLQEKTHMWVSETSHDYTRFKEPPLDEAMNKILNKVRRWPVLSIEIIGSWLWIKTVSADMSKYAIRFAFMDVHWSKKRKAWYWHPADFEFAENGKTDMTMEEMRKVFGSRKVEVDPWKLL